jgi:hypothetical protein
VKDDKRPQERLRCSTCECVYLTSETEIVAGHHPACPSCNEAVAFVDVIVIHVLFHGVSLCNLPGVPGDWPRGHRWVTIACQDQATCDTCRIAAQLEKARMDWAERFTHDASNMERMLDCSPIDDVPTPRADGEE